ncbi:MAG: HAD-IA family hydrolase [Bifidobacterium sp.]|jgi:2-haloacid dehalogenase|nr:HAD-IA family hydrolase [Bifidobacterium sp.]MCI1864820.1 HAD-IA family hydrolase [Bifidobacterium sp.]
MQPEPANRSDGDGLRASAEPVECGITDVVVDFCAVLIDWRPRRALEGLYPSGVLDMFFDPDDEWGFDYYDAMSDCGWSEERVIADYGRHHGPAVTWLMRLYFDRRRLALKGMIPGMGEMLESLHGQGIRLWGLTNFTRFYVDAARDMFPALRMLDGVMLSDEEHLSKPDRALFLRASHRFGLQGDHTLFIDDQQRNVDSALAAGWHAIRFEGASRLRKDLAARGVRVTPSVPQ